MNIAQRILASLYRVFGRPVHTVDVHGDLKSTAQQNMEIPHYHGPGRLNTSSAPQEFYDRLNGVPLLSKEERSGRGIRTFYPDALSVPIVQELKPTQPGPLPGMFETERQWRRKSQPPRPADEETPRIDYGVIFDYANKHRLDYNSLCSMVRRAVGS